MNSFSRFLLSCTAALPLFICQTLHASKSPESLISASEEQKIEAIVKEMTLTEKIGQMSLRDWSMYYNDKDLEKAKQDIREGRVGGMLNVSLSKLSPQAFTELQKIAVEESPHHIPLIFGQDVIHGYKTIFPIPLGQAASWNPDIIESGARVASKEAVTDGIRWTFAPMIDIARDPRWGRIAESLGEDPYLTSTLGLAMMRGFQTDDPSNPDTLAACAKHFVAYGAVEGGRDYNAAFVPEGVLRDVYLAPFQRLVDEGLLTIMSSYNTINGIPSTGNPFILKKILREEWGFNGFVVSDWSSVHEMVNHGVAEDDSYAGLLAASSGVDFEMYNETYEKYLPEHIDAGRISEADIDTAVKNILRVKMALGLWKKPYPKGGQEKTFLKKAFLAEAQRSAEQSMVLLKNKNGVLPLNKKQKIAVIGPLADAPFEQLGTWIYDGDKKDTRTFLPALKTYLKNTSNITYHPGVEFSRDRSTKGFADAVRSAKDADVIVYVGGEESVLTGEGHSRGDIRLPGVQQELIRELSETGKPLVQIIMAGRPIQLDDTLEQSDALIMAWHPGTMGGPALVNILFGDVSPSGRLPLTWPVASGQIPIYYNHLNTGRPPSDDNYTRMYDIQRGVFQHQPGNSSNLLDYGHLPEFPFGYGLTYSTFRYDKLDLSQKSIPKDGRVKVSAVIKNTGKVTATEVVQLYVRDLVASVARPVRELKGFQRITLKPGKSKKVVFELSAQALAFHNADMQEIVEAGKFHVWIAPNAQEGLQGEFEVTP